MITVEPDRLCIQPGHRILDIGCGTGRHTGAVIRIRDCHVVGTDLIFDALQAAEERLKFLEKADLGGGRWHLCLSDINTLPFDDRVFDAVICAEVLEHVGDEKRALLFFKIAVQAHIDAVLDAGFFAEGAGRGYFIPGDEPHGGFHDFVMVGQFIKRPGIFAAGRRFENG